MTTIDTPDSAKQLALVDAERKTLLEAGARLRDLPEVKALGLKPALSSTPTPQRFLDIQEQSTRTSTAAGRAIYQVDVVLRLDAAATIRRLGQLRKDQDASRALLELWQQVQEFQRQLRAKRRRPARIGVGRRHQAAQDRQRPDRAPREAPQWRR